MQDRWEIVIDGWTHYVSFQGREIVIGEHAGCGHTDNASAISLGEFLVGRHHRLIADAFGEKVLQKILDVARAKASVTLTKAELAQSASSVRKENPTKVCALLQAHAQMEPADDLYAFACGRLAHSRFSSIQVRAAQALSAWKEPRSVQPLRIWLDTLTSGASLHSLRRQAYLALENCVVERDTVWLIDRFLSLPPFEFQTENRREWYFSLRVILNRFPTEYAATRLAEECRQEDIERSRSALYVFGFVQFSNRLAVLDELRVISPQHPDLKLIESLLAREIG